MDTGWRAGIVLLTRLGGDTAKGEARCSIARPVSGRAAGLVSDLICCFVAAVVDARLSHEGMAQKTETRLEGRARPAVYLAAEETGIAIPKSLAWSS